MTSITCLSCHGDGLYHAPSSLGPYCFACKGTGKVTVRKPRIIKAPVLSATIRIADRCAGDPTKLSTENSQALAWLGLSVDDLLRYRELWNSGVREVAR